MGQLRMQISGESGSVFDATQQLVHSPQVPTALPVRPDTYYFALENKGAMYERMLQAQSICIYVPSGIHELKLELLAVTQ